VIPYQFSEGDELNGAAVAQIFEFPYTDRDTLLMMRKGLDTDECHLKREMAQLGWQYESDGVLVDDFIYFIQDKS
jgi:hypothetical protein